MPPALDRLLASPSALRLLRSIVNAPEPACPTLQLNARSTQCFDCGAPRRAYSSVPKLPFPGRWRQWRELSSSNGPIKAGKAHPNSRARRGELEDGNWTRTVHGHGEEKDDATTWAQELSYQERVYGLDGIRRVWTARRGFDLPTDDTLDAEFLWGTFIKAPDLVKLVIDHAADLRNRTGKVYPHLYELCMGFWLPKPRYLNDALDYHRLMLERLQLQTLPLRRLARRGKQRFKPKALRAFHKIYLNSNETDVYDEIVPALYKRGYTMLARKWHTQCVLRGDLPSPQMTSDPTIQRVSAEVAESSDTEAQPDAFLVGKVQRGKPKLDQGLLRRLRGRDTPPVRFEDSFCARMFATRAFLPDSIIRGLAIAGVNEIGPLSLRAMAARTDLLTDLPKYFDVLEENGIALQGCVFSLALDKFAKEGQWHLVNSMLESDQHPDVYDDSKLQQKLLDYYLEQQDWDQAHRTLAILSLFYEDSNTMSWNSLLQAHIRRFDPDQILRVLHSMHDVQALLYPETVLMVKARLRPRQRGQKPVSSTGEPFDDLRFVTRVFMTISECGIGRIPPDGWRELVRRFGISGRFRELRRLVLWLLCWYAPRHIPKFDHLPKPPFLDSATAKIRAEYPDPNVDYNFKSSSLSAARASVHPLKELFPGSFQQGLIVWGFKAGLLPNAPLEQSLLASTPAKRHFRIRFRSNGILKRVDWSLGLRTLVELRDLGVRVHPHNVSKALQTVFIAIFGPGRSHKKDNRIMALENRQSYGVYVREVNRIWGSTLLAEPESQLQSHPHPLKVKPRSSTWHPWSHHKPDQHRKAWLHLSEIFDTDSNSWAEDRAPKRIEVSEPLQGDISEVEGKAVEVTLAPSSESSDSLRVSDPDALESAQKKVRRHKRWK